MTPIEFILHATVLANSADSGPAGYRSAVSRAYYGAFLSARNLIEIELKRKCKIDKVSAHEVVQRFLMGCKVEQAVEMGQLLSNLHGYRKQADYDMGDATYEDQDEAKLCVERANLIIARLKECSTHQMKQKILAGISQHLRDAGHSP
jgi:uncharacterized protein (UPF0332 family)